MVNKNSTTITLTAGEEQTVQFDRSYPYFWVQNLGDSDVLISMDSGIVDGADGVIEVPAGGSCGTMHNYTANADRLYLLGDGKVQVMGTGSAFNPFKSSWKGGVDVSLSKEGYAADSKVVGDKLKVLQDVVNGVTHRFVTDNTTAYSKPVPVGAKIASVNRVGGKTICFNQHLINGDMSQETGWECKEDSYGELQYGANNGEKCAKAVVTRNFDKPLNFGIYQNFIDNTGHKIYISCTAQINTNTPNAMCYISCGFWNTFINDYSDPINTVYFYPNTKKHISVIFDTSKSTNKNEGIGIWTTSNTMLVTGDEIILYSMNYIDLTKMFGTGNEPATVEEFEAMFSAEYYPYDEGTLMPSPITAFHSTLDGRTLQTKEMPSAVLALDGYGHGISNSVCNHVNFETKTYHKMVGIDEETASVYELETPVVTDISELFPADFNIMNVMTGGKLVFENENKIAVPSEVEYIVDLAEVIAND